MEEMLEKMPVVTSGGIPASVSRAQKTWAHNGHGAWSPRGAVTADRLLPLLLARMLRRGHDAASSWS